MTNPYDPDHLLPQIEYALDLFGERLSSLDHAIDFLEDLREEIAEGTDTQNINDYLYGVLSRLKDAKRDLASDISMIKKKLSSFVSSVPSTQSPIPNPQ